MILPSTRSALALALLLLAAAAPAAMAQANTSPAPISEAQKQACTADFRRLCSGVFPGGGRVKQCLTEHVEELSPPCQEALAAHEGET